MGSLNIQIDSAGRQFLLDNNETIVLVLPQDEDCEYLVACVSFSPFGDNNPVDFLDDWIEYASTQSISNMDVIIMKDQKNVSKGNIYTVDNAGFELGSTPAYSDQVYGLLNKRNVDGYNLTCGLGQKINVSNNSEYYAINVYSVPHNQTIYFETNSKVWIFAAKGIESNMIIPAAMLTPNSNTQRMVTVGSYLEIDLKQTSTIYFDNLSHTFKVGSLPE